MRDPLSGQKFAGWWREYDSARRELVVARERLDVLLALENTPTG